jgi:glutaredoxin
MSPFARLALARNRFASGLRFFASLPLPEKLPPIRLAQRVASELARRIETRVVAEEKPAPDPRATVRVMETEEEKPLADPKVAAIIYGRETDLWTGRATRLFEERKVTYLYIDLESDDGAQGAHFRLYERLVRETKRNDPPWVFIRGKLIGGYHELDELDRLGQLETMLLPPGDRPKDPRGRTRIVIAGQD